MQDTLLKELAKPTHVFFDSGDQASSIAGPDATDAGNFPVLLSSTSVISAMVVGIPSLCLPANNVNGDDPRTLTNSANGCRINIPVMAPNLVYYRVRRSSDNLGGPFRRH